MDDIMVRCSSISKIMGDSSRGKGLTDKQLKTLNEYEKRIKENGKPLTVKQMATYNDFLIRKNWRPEYDLTDGAKTYVASQVKRIFYGFKSQNIQTPKTLKGQLNEDANIELYNDVFFTDYKKNTIRLANKGISGEWDAADKTTTLDIKSAWTWDTFCALESELKEHCEKSGYFMQGRGYMFLNNTEVFEVAHCMSTTPTHLIDMFEEDISRHIVSEDIPLEKCITVVSIERDFDKEKEILYKVNEAKRYAKWYFEQLTKKTY